MKTNSSTIEESLKQELWMWLHRTLDYVDALRSASPVRGAREAAVMAAVRNQTREAIEAVRLYASECSVVAASHTVSTATLRLAYLATQLCLRLEEEVNALDEELVIYSS